MKALLTLLLLHSLWAKRLKHDSPLCHDFCCQSAETAQICDSINDFFRDEWKRDATLLQKINADCERCIKEHSPVSDWESPNVEKFMKASAFVICQSMGKCKRSKVGRVSILGDERCGWGPQYWCNSMENAARCQSYPYCGQEWIGQRLANAKCDRQCLTCQKTLSSVHFKGNALESVKNRCVGPQCSPVTQHLIELITLRNLSHGGVSPAILCNKLGMCEGTPVDRKSDRFECQWAHSIWIRTRQLFSQGFTDYDEVLDLLLAECDKNATVSDCQQAVCHYLPTFISKYGEGLRSKDALSGEDACEYVLACSQEETAADVTGMLCDKCERFVTETRVKAICQVKKVFNFVIAELCRFFGPLETKCIVASSDLKEALVSLIGMALNTKRLCSPFCREGAQFSNVEFTLELLSGEAAKGVCGTDIACQRATEPIVRAAFKWFSVNDTAQRVTDDNFSLCQACHSISTEDLKILMWDSGNSSQKIERLLPQLCYMRPTKGREACLSLMNRYGRSIARLLLQLEPTGNYGEMCDALGVCELEERCFICEHIADELNFLIRNTTNITDETVIWALNQTCQSINTTMRKECEEFVSNFEKAITALLVKHHVNTNSLCRAIGVCLRDMTKFPPATCDVCRFAVLAIETAIARNVSKEQIIDWVQRECKILPHAYHNACGNIVQNNLPKILQLLAFIVRPDLICFELGLCSLGDDDLCPIKHSLNATVPVGDYRLCTACQMGIITVRAWIRSNEIVPKFLSLAEKACRALFSNDRADDCVDAANSVSRLVNHWLTEGDPLQTCRWLRFCPYEAA